MVRITTTSRMIIANRGEINDERWRTRVRIMVAGDHQLGDLHHFCL